MGNRQRLQDREGEQWHGKDGSADEIHDALRCGVGATADVAEARCRLVQLGMIDGAVHWMIGSTHSLKFMAGRRLVHALACC